MDAREYLATAQANQRIVQLAKYDETDQCVGRGRALVIDPQQRIAVMLEHCGFPGITLVRAGNLVQYVPGTGAEWRIAGDPVDIQWEGP
ncbi:MAG: hypothetical protein WD278_20030 [Pirellulales bacterium]